MDKKVLYFFILIFVFIIFFSFSTDLAKRQKYGFFSDESSYFSVIQSLAFDGDLEYTRNDIKRIREYFPGGPMGMFLKRTEDGKIFFAKSYVYPLFVAPFFRVFGVHGILLFNGLLIFLTLLLGYLLLNRFHPERSSLLTSLYFTLATVIPIYIWWITADLFNYFVLFAALFFFFYPFKNRLLFYLSPIFFSLSAFSKPYNVLAISVVYLILIYRKEWKRFAIISMISILTFGALAGFYCFQTGEWNYKLFMGGERRTFHNKYPFEFPENPKDGTLLKDANGAVLNPYTFNEGFKMTFDTYWDRFYNTPEITLLNLFYFIFGRFGGIFIYFFPAVFLFAVFLFQKKVAEDFFLLAAIAVAVLTYLILIPDNYIGGSGTVGNRYFFNIFPLFFFLGFKHRIFKYLQIPFIIAAVFLGGTYVDSNYRSTFARYTGISFPVNLFPPEKTQFASLPSNENPRAFGTIVRSGPAADDSFYRLYFLNDNFYKVEEGRFWTYKDQTLELFLATHKEVKSFVFTLESHVKRNPFWLRVEGRETDGVILKRSHTVEIENIRGLKMKNQYIYHMKLKADKWGSPRNDRFPKDDKRMLGLFVKIKPEY